MSAPQERRCQQCGAPFMMTGRYQRFRYCSEACARAKQSNTNRLAPACRKKVQVGLVFVRSDDGAPVMVKADGRGLPYVDPLEEHHARLATAHS